MPGAPRSTATTSSSNQSTTAGAGSGELRQRKQKIMLRQMQRHDRREQAHLNLMQTTGQAATSDLLRTYCRTVALLLVVGAALLLYAQPRFLFRSNRNRTNNKNNRNEPKGAERLPARSVVTLFPPDVDIQASLPRFFNGYAIATAQNWPARQAVRRVAQQRRVLTDPARNDKYNQKITLAAWEQADFQRQLSRSGSPGAAMDRHCGPGFADLYYSVMSPNINHNHSNSSRAAAAIVGDALVVSCLLKSGVADGFVQRTVTPLASLTRGLQGVAAVRTATTTTATTSSSSSSKPRIHSSLLILPILTLEQRQQSHNSVSPSTLLPVEMTKYLLAEQPREIHRPSELEEFVRKWEEFLYQVIAKETKADPSKWVFLNAACTAAERAALAGTQKLVATTCNSTATATTTGSEEPPDDNDNNNCCSFYDPNLKLFLPRTDRRRSNNEK